MKNLKFVKEFIFNKAQYNLSDGNGSKVLLKIDYKNNKFEIKNLNEQPRVKNPRFPMDSSFGQLHPWTISPRFSLDQNKTNNPEFMTEVENIAKDLLASKHAVNFADR